MVHRHSSTLHYIYKGKSTSIYHNESRAYANETVGLRQRNVVFTQAGTRASDNTTHAMGHGHSMRLMVPLLQPNAQLRNPIASDWGHLL